MNKEINLIGIVGVKQSNKNLVGDIIRALTAKCNTEELYRMLSGYANYITEWEIVGFADKLKQIVSLLTGVHIDDLEKEEVKNSDLKEKWNIEISPHENTWVNALFSTYSEKDKWIITDVRHENEVKAIKDRGGLILYKEPSPDYKYEDNHASEKMAKNFKDYDEIIPYCDSIEELIEIVRKALHKHNIL